MVREQLTLLLGSRTSWGILLKSIQDLVIFIVTFSLIRASPQPGLSTSAASPQFPTLAVTSRGTSVSRRPMLLSCWLSYANRLRKLVLGNSCVILTCRLSSLSEVEKVELCWSTIPKVSALAVRIVVSWVRLGFVRQFMLEKISGAFLANLLHKAGTARSQMRLLRVFVQSGVENFQGLWRLYNLSGQRVPMYDCCTESFF